MPSKRSKHTTKFLWVFGLVLGLVAYLISCTNSRFDVEIAASENERDSTLLQIVTARKIPKNDLKIVIEKSKYTLHVEYKDVVLMTYPCVFGFNPIDDKHEEGDGCTPEGTFKIRSKYAHKSWAYFIWIDYPNKDSWNKFNTRKANGEISESATIGGEIGIHGVPTDADDLIASKTNWTLGCISLTRQDITDLFKSVGDKSMIQILH